MDLKIIDASVAIKWFMATENGRDQALEVLDAICTNPRFFAVPELFFNEMLAVLCRLAQDATQVQKHMHSLQNLNFHRIGNGAELLAEATIFAFTHKLSGYDAVYAAAASLSKGLWLTADAKAHKRIQNLGISQLVGG